MSKRPSDTDALLADQRGIASTEYVVLLVVICIMVLGTWAWFGPIVHEIIYGPR